MPEVEDAMGPGGQEAAPEHRIGLVGLERLEQTDQILRVVFEIGVLDRDEIARYVAEARAQRRPLALIDLVGDDTDLGMPGRERAGPGQAVVARGVVDDHDLEGPRRRRDRSDAGDAGLECGGLVVAGDDDAERGGHGSLARARCFELPEDTRASACPRPPISRDPARRSARSAGADSPPEPSTFLTSAGPGPIRRKERPPLADSDPNRPDRTTPVRIGFPHRSDPSRRHR